MVIDGKKISEDLLSDLKSKPKPKKYLAVVLVGNNSSSISFIKQKRRASEYLGVDFRLYEFSESIKNDELRKSVLKIASHKSCGGVLVQLPLPSHINKHYILNVLPADKDVDVLGERALGAFYAGRNLILPPAVETVSQILKTINCELRKCKVAVLGLGFLVGKPVSLWLHGKCKEILLFDEGSDFLLLKEADLVISGIGKSKIIKPDMFKNKAVVIDFGYENGFGDLDISSEENIEHLTYTPTPGGTGPILVVKLLENFYKLCDQ